MKIENPYLLFLGEAADQLAAKTAHGIADWRHDWCLGQLRMEGCKADVGLPDMTIEAAVAAGAKTLVVGVVNAGGIMSERWIDILESALIAGLDVAAGMHSRLVDVPRLAAAASQHGRSLFDVRHQTRNFEVGNGRKRTGKRLLTVGTDCAVGKKYTALAIEKEMRERGMNVDFRATGQTGILIAGGGVSIDAVVADFISGAAEWLSPDNTPDHWDVIEGQGSLFHAAFSGVSLGLLHGAQPDVIVLCHEPARAHMRGLPGYALPDLRVCIEANLAAARLTNPAVVCVGVSVNTSSLAPAEARRLLLSIEDALGLPAVNTFQDGAGPIVDGLR